MKELFSDPEMMKSFLIVMSVLLVLLAFMGWCMWKIFEKAGEEGWKAIVPIYGNIILLKLIGKPWWWLLLMIIPYVGTVFTVWQMNMLSKSFGKETGFTVGLILLPFVFLPILAFGNATYLGPYGDPVAFQNYNSANQFDFEKNM